MKSPTDELSSDTFPPSTDGDTGCVVDWFIIGCPCVPIV